MASILTKTQLQPYEQLQRACLSAATEDDFIVTNYLCRRWYGSNDHTTRLQFFDLLQKSGQRCCSPPNVALGFARLAPNRDLKILLSAEFNDAHVSDIAHLPPP